jgi:hypothetical protein
MGGDWVYFLGFSTHLEHYRSGLGIWYGFFKIIIKKKIIKKKKKKKKKEMGI